MFDPTRVLLRSLLLTLLVGLLASVVATPVAAQYFGRNKVNYDDFDFRVLETEHFEIYYYPEAEVAVRDAARKAERWYQRHTQTFLHRFDEKKPIIFYANDADFQQTNVTQGAIGPGVGGFTEPIRERVVMPLTGSYGANDHVIGHELVHSFQFDLAFNSGQTLDLRRVPLWLIEGMAEYLTIGRYDPHTAMWMRDAAIQDKLPTIQQLANPRDFFPYRYGQAVLAYLAGKYGDQTVTDLYKLSGRTGVDSSFVYLYNQSADSLSAEWAQAIKEAYLPLVKDRTPADSAGRRVLAKDIDGGNLNVSPVLSPDGRYVAFLSERDLFDITLYVADAESGEVLESLGSIATTPDLDAIRFISSAGTWDPTGRKLAFISFAKGDNEISVWDVDSGKIERSFRVQGVTAMTNPAWSPDGTKIAFSGTDGGISDLYVLDLETRAVRQLTNDRYADMQPTWSPDGQTLAITTDRRTTSLETLRTSQVMQLALVDVDSGDLSIVEPFPGAHHHNPQFSPDGQSLYFISDGDGFKDIYRKVIGENAPDTGTVYRVTNLQTGVSGITALSPAMSIARQSGAMMFSVYSGGAYVGFALEREEAQGEMLDAMPAAVSRAGDISGRDPNAQPSTFDLGLPPPTQTTDAQTTDAQAADTTDADATDVDSTAVAASDATSASSDTTDTAETAADRLPEVADVTGPPRAGMLPPYDAYGRGLVDTYLGDSGTGLPPAGSFEDETYSNRLTLEGIFPPTIGVSVGGPFGGGIGGGVGLRFGDMLGNQQLDVIFQANGTFRDVGGGVNYTNRSSRFNYGLSASHLPIIVGQSISQSFRGFNVITERVFISQVGVTGAYPLSTTRRFEFGAGGIRYGFGTNVRGPDEAILEEQIDGNPFFDRDTELFSRFTTAFVIDHSDFGLTSPVRGARYRFEVTPFLGTEQFVSTRVDLRRYFYARPFTFALKGLHAGNFGATRDDIFGEEFLGFAYSPTFIRGYSFNSFDLDDCTTPRCDGDFDRLIGTQAAKVSAEIRIPVLGVKPLSLFNTSVLPLEVALFTDVGLAWSEFDDILVRFDRTAGPRSTPVASSGVSTRINFFGSIILEPYWAYAYQRERPSTFGLRFVPGW